MAFQKLHKAAACIAAAGLGLGLAGGASAQPAPVNNDTPEEIAKDAARDLKDSRFYNKPGATRAQYDADWQECRLIARGSRIIDGNMPYYNPAMYNPSISPLAAGIGGGIGAAIAAAIAEGIQRRANRKQCLMIKGWRMVRLSGPQAAAVAAMGESDKQAYFNRIVGAATVDGEIEKLDTFSPPADPALAVTAGLAGPATLFVHKKPAKAVLPALAPGEGAIVMAFRRNGATTAGRHGLVQMFRYDRDKRDLLYQPRDWKKKGDTATYVVSIPSGDKNAAYELRVMPVTAGDYVLDGTTVGAAMPPMTSNCFGAPVMRVEAGQYAYLGDANPFVKAQLADGTMTSALVMARHFAAARDAMAKLRPDIAAAMVEPAINNRATYSCAAVTMTRFDWPGMTELPAPVVPAAGAVAASK